MTEPTLLTKLSGELIIIALNEPSFFKERKGGIQMSERYWITGAQIGLLIALDSQEKRQNEADKIVDKQFITNCYTEKEQKQFRKAMRNWDKNI